MFSFQPKHKHASVMVRCIGCTNMTELSTATKIKVPKGKAGMWADGRRVTPTGGRFGMPGTGLVRRGFPVTETGFGCLDCQLAYPSVNERF